MCPGVDFLELLDAYFGINLGGLKLLMSEQLLDEADVRAAFEHVRCLEKGQGVKRRI